MSALALMKEMGDILSKTPKVGILGQFMIYTLSMASVWAYYKVGMAKGKIYNDVNKKIETLEKIVNDLITTISTDRDGKLKLREYMIELQDLMAKKTSRVRDIKVHAYLSVKANEIIELYQAMQDGEKTGAEIDFWITAITGKSEDFYYKAEDMVSMEWCEKFHVDHSWRTAKFKEELLVLYRDTENNKAYRLFKIFQEFLDETLSQALAMEYSNRQRG